MLQIAVLRAIKQCKAVNPFTIPSCSRAGLLLDTKSLPKLSGPGLRAIHTPCSCSEERFSCNFKVNVAVKEELSVFLSTFYFVRD